jgi:hypothetical protein
MPHQSPKSIIAVAVLVLLPAFVTPAGVRPALTFCPVPAAMAAFPPGGSPGLERSFAGLHAVQSLFCEWVPKECFRIFNLFRENHLRRVIVVASRVLDFSLEIFRDGMGTFAAREFRRAQERAPVRNSAQPAR